MKNLILLLFLLAFVACQNAPKNEANSENFEKRDPSVFEAKTGVLAVETMPDSLIKPFMRKLPPKVVARFIYSPPFVVDYEDSQIVIPPAVSPKMTQLSLDSVKPMANKPILAHFFQEFEKKSQFFIVNMPTEPNEEPSEEVVITGKEGTQLTIGRNVFETENGQNTEGSISLELKEFYTLSDIVAADLTTQSDGELLETGGMIYVSATDSKGQKLRIKSGKSIKIEMPRLPNSSEKQLFYGEKQADSSINWRLAPVIKGEFGLGAYRIVEQNPEFPDGQKALFTFLGQKIRYPKIAYDNGIEGTVHVGFVVNEMGDFEDIRILRSASQLLNKEALRVIQLMPLWKAGWNNGKRVKTVFTLPIKFRIDDAVVATASDSIQFINDAIAMTANRENEKKRLQDEVISDKMHEKMEETAVYAFQSQKLGWINSDRFANIKKPKTAIKVVCDNQNTRVKIIFKNFKSILRGAFDKDNTFILPAIPIGEPVSIIVTYVDKTQTKAAIIETITENNQILTPDLQAITPKDFLDKLKALTFNNQ